MIRYGLSIRYDDDPVHYGSLQERADELVETFRREQLSDRGLIEELRDVLVEMRSRDCPIRAKRFDGTTELSFYYAVEETLDTEARGIDEEQLLDLTGALVDTVEEFVTIVEWKEKVHVQRQIRKQVTPAFALYKSGLDRSSGERDALTTRVIQLARAHYE